MALPWMTDFGDDLVKELNTSAIPVAKPVPQGVNPTTLQEVPITTGADTPWRATLRKSLSPPFKRRTLKDMKL